MNKIYVYARPCNEERGIDQRGALDIGVEYFTGDCYGTAIAEDGEYLTSHISSSIGWFRNDMGLTNPNQRKHKEEYHNKYPDGYELIEIDYNSKDPDFVNAKKLFHKKE